MNLPKTLALTAAPGMIGAVVHADTFEMELPSGAPDATYDGVPGFPALSLKDVPAGDYYYRGMDYRNHVIRRVGREEAP